MTFLNQIFDDGNRICSLARIVFRVLAVLIAIVGAIAAIGSMIASGQVSEGKGALIWFGLCQLVAFGWITVVVWVRGGEVGSPAAEGRPFPILTILRTFLKIAGESILGYAVLAGLGLMGIYSSASSAGRAGSLPGGPFGFFLGNISGEAGFLLGLTIFVAMSAAGVIYWMIFSGLSELIQLLMGIHEHGRPRHAEPELSVPPVAPPPPTVSIETPTPESA